MNAKLYESLVRDYGDECVRITQNLIDRAYKQGRADAIANLDLEEINEIAEQLKKKL